MKLEGRQILEIVGVTAVVASLVFVGLELQQARSATTNERTLSRVEIGNEFRSQINQYSEIWMKGNGFVLILMYGTVGSQVKHCVVLVTVLSIGWVGL